MNINDLQKKLRPILNNSKQSKDSALYIIKNEVNAGDFEQVLDSNIIFQKLKLHNNNFKNAEEIVQRNPFNYTGNVKKELYWLLYNIKHDALNINQFLIKKNEFEKQFFLNKYEEASKLLESIRQDIGENLWTIEMTLLLKEHQFGTTQNWTELSNFLKELKSPFYQFLISFYSKRIEENMSFENCISQFLNDFNEVVGDTMVKDFLVFKSLYNSVNFDYSHQNMESVLYLANLFNSIDQYLIIIDVLVKLVANNSKNDKLILQFALKIYPFIYNDHRLKNIVNLIDEKKDIIILENTKSVLFIIDEYSIGNFESCIFLCTNKLGIDPLTFELYEIYCKSLINLNLKFKETNISPLIDKILFLTYNVLLNNSESIKNGKKLLKYSFAFLSFNFGKQISAFIFSLEIDINGNEHSLIGCLSSSLNNPRLLSLNIDKRNVIDKNQYFNYSTSFKTNMFINGNINLTQVLISKNQIQSDVYIARNLFKQSRFEEVINKIENYIGKTSSPFYYDSILYFLFESYIKTDKLKEAILLTATILSDRVFFTNKLDISRLIQKVQNEGYSFFSEMIELPILFSFSIKNYDLYEIYTDFMFFYDEEHPSRLNIENLIAQSSLEKVIYFLKEVCTVSTIRYSLEFSSIDEAEQERCEICKLLKTLDNYNYFTYDKEISDIVRTGAIREALKEVDAGRLYINIESLKKLQLSNIKESYARFKDIELTTKNKSLIGFNSSKERNWISTDFSSKDNNPQFDNPSFLAFKGIYIEIRENFLFSKEYGLDSCLSTNFRHGAIKNHLRSVFEKLNLITSKTGEVYIDNLYWMDKNGTDFYLNSNVQQRLKKFSFDIDEFTSYIINNLIQIQTERHTEKKEGLFDYSVNDDLLWDYFQINKGLFDSSSSINEILYTTLIEETKNVICLNIYTKFTIDINKKYQELIENLQTDLRTIGLSNQSELLPNIQKSSTDIQTELEVIGEWFILNTTSSSSLLDIGIIINASVEYTNKINPNNCIKPDINIQFTLPAYSSLIFVFNILFNNIIQHSKLFSDDLKVKIDVFNPEGNFFEIKISNNISDIVNINEVERKLHIVQNNWNNHENIERSNIEGGSGFDKIKRILLYEVMAKTDKFEYLVTNQEVTISLFLSFKSFIINIEKIIRASLFTTFYSKLNAQNYIEPIIVIHYPAFYVNSSLVVVFNLLINDILENSKLSIEDIELSFEVFEPEKNHVEIKFTNNISEDLNVSNINNMLQEVKENWNNYNNLNKSNTKELSLFDKIKRTLLYDTLSKSEKFEFSVNRKEVSISLFLLINQSDNEKDFNY